MKYICLVQQYVNIVLLYYQYVVILTTDHYTLGTYHDGANHFVNFVLSARPISCPSATEQYDSVSFVFLESH